MAINYQKISELNFIKNFELFYKDKNKKNLNNLKRDYKLIVKNYLDKNSYFLIIKNFEKNGLKLEKKIKLFESFVSLLGQNDKNEKVVKVRPKKLLIKLKKKEKKILRYHQTNLGGSIHSDGPQLKIPPNYIVMACMEQAQSGGDSIIANTKKIYDDLNQNNKKTLKILKEKIIFERRGFKKEKLTFLKPIFLKKKNKLSFRYLRDYIDSGFKVESKIMSNDQSKALKELDKMLISKKYQKKYRLDKGDIILLNNNILAHGRTAFKISKNINRTLLRAWIK